jgi:hypothetical protein
MLNVAYNPFMLCYAKCHFADCRGVIIWPSVIRQNDIWLIVMAETVILVCLSRHCFNLWNC